MEHIPPAPQTVQEPQPVPATYTLLYTEPLSSLEAYDNHIVSMQYSWSLTLFIEWPAG